MLVAPSREAAILYKRELDSLNAPKSKIIMTSNLGETGKDGKLWDEYCLAGEQREKEAEKFKSPDDPTKILIVVDMLLVGYDVPICQVMYLDRGLREHNLLQAIARVNRPYDEPKTYGLIVDYSGITRELGKALEMFEEQDVDGALEPLDDLLNELKFRHLDVMSYFSDIDKNNNDQILEKFEPADLREKFEYDFKMFSKVLDAVMPAKEVDPYLNDFKFASKARQLIRTYYEGVKPSAKPYAKKIQKLIDDHIRSLHISELMNPLEITYENFIAFVKKKVKSDRARTALIKNKAIMVIDEFKANNPVYYEKLRERLEKIIQDEYERRKKNADYFTKPEQYEEIYNQAIHEEQERKKVFGDYEASPLEFSIYGELNQIQNNRKTAINLTKDLYSKIQPETEIVEWKNNTDTEKHMKIIIYDTLSKAKFSEDKIEELMDKIITLTKNRI
jgi:type I restriction enzyme R subunit